MTSRKARTHHASRLFSSYFARQGPELDDFSMGTPLRVSRT